MQIFKSWLARPWLSALALVVIITAWGAAGVWGWLQTSPGVFGLIAIALTIGAQVFAARAAANAATAASIGHRVTLIGLGVMCLLWTGFSGKQALDADAANRLAPYEAALAAYDRASADLDRVDAAIAAVPALRSDIPAVRLKVLTEARTAELAKLEAQRLQAATALATAPKPMALPALPEWLKWSMVLLIELLEFFGFWALGMKARKEAALAVEAAAEPAPVVTFNPGRELVARRWAKR